MVKKSFQYGYMVQNFSPATIPVTCTGADQKESDTVAMVYAKNILELILQQPANLHRIDNGALSLFHLRQQKSIVKKQEEHLK
jgi:hypothetical protein